MSQPTVGAKIVLDGEREYRQSISNINSDMRVMGSEMKLMTAKFDGNANSIEALTRKDKLLNEQLEKQKQKVETARDALEKMKEKYGDNDARVDRWKITLNNAQTQVERLSTDIKKNGEYLDEAKRSTDGNAKSIDKFGKRAKDSAGEAKSFGTIVKANLTSQAIIGGIKSLGSALKSCSEYMYSMVSDSAKYADDISTMSKVTGLSTDSLQEFNYMADLVDVSLDTISGSLRKNTQSMQKAYDGNKTYAGIYKDLGVEIKDSNGEMRNSEDVYFDCISSLGKMQNETKRNSTAMKIFGKSAQDLNPLILTGSDGLKEMKTEAKKMGAVMSGDALDSLNDTQDASDRMKQSMDILKRQIGSKLAPVVTDISTKFTKFATENKDKIADFVKNGVDKLSDGIKFVVEHFDDLKTIAVTVAGALAGIFVAGKITAMAQGVLTVVTTFKALKTATEGATVAQLLLNAAESASPVGIIVGAVGLLVGGLVAFNAVADESTDVTVDLTKEQQNLYDNIDNTKNSVDNMKQSVKDSGTEIDNQYDTYEDYVTQLEKICDENGNIKKGHEKEAKYITGELSKAYGIQIDIINNKKIPAYNKMIKKIKEAMTIQKAEKMLDTNSGNYTEAVKGVKNAAVQFADATDNYKKMKREYETSWKKVNDFDKAWDEAYTSANYDKIDQLSKQKDGIEALRDKLGSMADNCDQAKAKMDDAESSYVGFNTVITNYTKLQKAVQKGNRDEIKKYLDLMSNDFITSKNGTKNTLEQQVTDCQHTYDSMKKAVKQGLDGVSESDVKEAKKWLDKAKKEYAKKEEESKKDGHNIGKSFSDGFLKGLKELKKGTKIVVTGAQAIVDAMKTQLVIKSPSHVTEQIGIFTGQGFDKGVEKSMKVAKQNVAKQLADVSNITSPTLTTSAKTSIQASIENSAAMSNNASGDLVVQMVTPDGAKLYETVYKEFRKEKRRDPSVSFA